MQNAALYDFLAEKNLKPTADFPIEQLQKCSSFGVFRTVVPKELGGLAYTKQQLLELFVNLSSCCLSTAFVLSQFLGAIERIVRFDSSRSHLISQLASGEKIATLGISQLGLGSRYLI